MQGRCGKVSRSNASWEEPSLFARLHGAMRDLLLQRLANAVTATFPRSASPSLRTSSIGCLLPVCGSVASAVPKRAKSRMILRRCFVSLDVFIPSLIIEEVSESRCVIHVFGKPLQCLPTGSSRSAAAHNDDGKGWRRVL